MYTVKLSRKAQKDLLLIDNAYYEPIQSKIMQLAHNPRPNGCKKLFGYENLYRVKHADYRIIYNVTDIIKIVNIVRVKHRKEVYKNL